MRPTDAAIEPTRKTTTMIEVYAVNEDAVLISHNGKILLEVSRADAREMIVDIALALGLAVDVEDIPESRHDQPTLERKPRGNT